MHDPMEFLFRIPAFFDSTMKMNCETSYDPDHVLPVEGPVKIS